MCKLSLGSWRYQTEQLQINIGKLNEYATSRRGTWRVLSIKQTSLHNTKTFRNLSRITYEVNLKRNTWFYQFNFALPACLFAVLALGSFLLPLDSGEKVSVPVALFLSETLVLSSILPYVPTTTDCLPLLSK